MSTVRRPEPTPEELRATWQRCRTSTWPRTFEEAMADALLSRLLRLNALHPPRAHRKAAPTAQAQRTHSTQPALHQARGYFDRKRAAAGERDDD